MARAKKDGEKISFYVDRQVMEDLRAYAEKKGQTVTMAMERILRLYLDERESCDYIWMKKRNTQSMEQNNSVILWPCDTTIGVANTSEDSCMQYHHIGRVFA